MPEEVASAFVERRAFEAALAETEMHRAANVALESQLGQAHADLLLAQADAETLRHKIEIALPMISAFRDSYMDAAAEHLEAQLSIEHPGQALADEVRAARAREAGLKLAADQYSESRDQWMLKAKAAETARKAAIERGAADHAIATAARAWRTARETLNGIADAEATLLAAVAASEKGVSE